MRAPSSDTVAAALSRVIELADAGAPPKKRAAARAHAEALCRRWKLSLREEQAADSREVDGGSMTLSDMAPTTYDRNRNRNGTHG